MVESCKKDKVTGKLKEPVTSTIYYELFKKLSNNDKTACSKSIKISYANKELMSDETKEKIKNAFLRSYGGDENYKDAESIISIKNNNK
ncbi:MAG: hypothetical protein M1168_00085 [Candidatus Marsarchaeota archaeon]|nr:hypothetical protein [Candidatus Marsarchaeota archaeon]MCL5094371.1 hypothetical protein [Candidatus Marsarchaeota archaeon]